MPRFFKATSTSPMRCDDDGRKTLGRLVEQEHLGAGAQDARDGKHLLLAARQLACPGSCAAPAGSETVGRFPRRSCRPPRPWAAAQVLVRRSGSRRCRAPPARSRCPAWATGGAAAASGPGRASGSRPRACARMPMMARKRRGLAGAVAAEQRDASRPRGYRGRRHAAHGFRRTRH